MKKFKKQSQGTIEKTPMIDKLIDFDLVEKMRVAVYDTSLTAEVDFHFSTPQPEWENKAVVKLRNNLYKINNIAYKVPADFQDAEPFYEMAVARAREFKKYTNSDFHNKLGKRFPDRYYTVPFTFFSYDPTTKTGILQITNPIVTSTGKVDYTTEYQDIEFELNYEGNGLRFGWLGE